MVSSHGNKTRILQVIDEQALSPVGHVGVPKPLLMGATVTQFPQAISQHEWPGRAGMKLCRGV
jgi:hypothetical protein